MASRKQQQDELERAQEALYIDPSDFKARRPAARCRGCGCLTWQVSIATGLRRVPNPQHADGCEKPPGKFDRQEADGCLPKLDRAELAARVRSSVPKPAPVKE